MGTDRDQVGDGPCPCGKGTITVDCCSPDHPWGGGSWYEATLNCRDCKETHSIVDTYGKRPKLVLKKDTDKVAAADAAWHGQLRAIEATEEFKNAKAKITGALSLQKSVAAKHRFLAYTGLGPVSIGTFRKHQNCHLSGSNVAKAMSAMGMPDVVLDKLTAKADRLWPATQFEPPAVKTGVYGMEK